MFSKCLAMNQRNQKCMVNIMCIRVACKALLQGEMYYKVSLISLSSRALL